MFVTVSAGVRHPVLDVRSKNELANLADRRLHGVELMHQLDAAAIRVGHALDRLNLTGDPA